MIYVLSDSSERTEVDTEFYVGAVELLVVEFDVEELEVRAKVTFDVGVRVGVGVIGVLTFMGY